MKAFRNPSDVHSPVAGYTHQVEIGAGERMLILSGQIGMRLDGSIPEDPVEQLKVALENVLHNLEAAAMRVEDLVKITLYLAGEMDPGQRRETLTAFLGEHKPCMTLVYVVGLASPAIKVEVDAWASRTP